MNTPVLETEDGPIAGMTRKDFLRGIAALGMGLPLTGLALPGAFAQDSAPKAGGTLTFNLTASPSNFDPMSNGSSTTLGIISPCYNSLVRFDPMDPNTVIGDLATSWEVSEDGKTYTFHLPDNVLFHDGVPMTSADVKTTFDWIRNPPEGIVSNRKGMLEVVHSIEAPDATTVVFTLKRPLGSFLNNLSSGWMLVQPKHVLEATGAMKDLIVGTGPFKLKEVVSGVSIELEKNPDYWVAGLPYLDGIKAFVIPDQGATWNYLQNGQLGIFMSIQGQEAGQFATGGDVTVLESPSTSVIGVTFNTEMAPFNDSQLRKAACLAIDRATALEVGRYAIGPDQLGLAMSLSAVANLFALPLAAYLVDRVPRATIIAVSLLATAAALVGIGLASSAPMLFAGMIAIGLATGIGGPAIGAYAVDVVPPHQQGAAMGLLRFGGDFGYLVGPLAIGTIVDVSHIGYDGGLFSTPPCLLPSAPCSCSADGAF